MLSVATTRRGTRRASPFGALAPTVLGALLVACANPRADERDAEQPKVVEEPAPEPASEPAPSEPAPREPLPFAWPLPTGWIAETIPFPLGFAPSLPHRGLEELRFAPGMFQAASEEFWSYAFVWWLEGEVAFDAATLNAELVAYYEGLSLAVEPEGFDRTLAAVVAELAPTSTGGERVARFAGQLSTHDPFATHARVELRVEVDMFRCAAEDRTVALFRVSPQPREHAIWTQLAELSDAFRCSL